VNGFAAQIGIRKSIVHVFSRHLDSTFNWIKLSLSRCMHCNMRMRQVDIWSFQLASQYQCPIYFTKVPLTCCSTNTLSHEVRLSRFCQMTSQTFWPSFGCGWWRLTMRLIFLLRSSSVDPVSCSFSSDVLSGVVAETTRHPSGQPSTAVSWLGTNLDVVLLAVPPTLVLLLNICYWSLVVRML